MDNTYSRNVAPAKLELLVAITEAGKAAYYLNLIRSYDVNMHVVTLGKGTAKAEIINYLGLSESSRTVIFSVVRGDRLAGLMTVLDEKFRTLKGGSGIAVSIPLTSVIGTLVYGFLSNDKRTVKDES